MNALPATTGGTPPPTTTTEPGKTTPKVHHQQDTTLNKIMMALLTAGVLAWGASITNTVNKVTGLEPQIEQLQRNDRQQSEWISTWPTEGELAADVRQTRDIEILFQDMADALTAIDANDQRIDEALTRIEGRVRDLETTSTP